MKSGLLVAVVLSTLALTNAAATPGKYSDIAAMLRQYELSSDQNLALKENTEEDDEEVDEDDSAIVQEANALLSSVIQGDGDDGMLLAAMMEEDEDDAVAQFRFIRRALRRLRNSRLGGVIRRFRNSPAGRRVTNRLRSRFCGSGK